MTDEGDADEVPAAHTSGHVGDADQDEVDPGWPWSFLLLVVAGAAYLFYRLVEAVAGLL